MQIPSHSKRLMMKQLKLLRPGQLRWSLSLVDSALAAEEIILNTQVKVLKKMTGVIGAHLEKAAKEPIWHLYLLLLKCVVPKLNRNLYVNIAQVAVENGLHKLVAKWTKETTAPIWLKAINALVVTASLLLNLISAVRVPDNANFATDHVDQATPRLVKSKVEELTSEIGRYTTKINAYLPTLGHLLRL